MHKSLNIRAELAALEAMSPKQLREKYHEVFDEPSRSGNRRFLIKRIAWRIQANAEGDLPERVRQRALEIARDSDLRTTMPKVRRVESLGGATIDRRVTLRPAQLATPGTQYTRNYKGRTVVVTVLTDGFEYGGQKYRSLSAVAKEITGTHLSGHAFFGLKGRRSKEISK